MPENSRSCLLIDDDPDDQFLFMLALEKAFPEIICEVASDGQFAIDMLEKKMILPFVIFLDINMPRMDGLNCLKKLKSHHFLCQIPVYIYTTSLQKGVDELCRSIGAAGCTVKYSRLNDLLSYMKNIINPIFSVLH